MAVFRSSVVFQATIGKMLGPSLSTAPASPSGSEFNRAPSPGCRMLLEDSQSDMGLLLQVHLGNIADEEALRERRAHVAAHQAGHQLAHRQPVLAAQPVQQRHRMELQNGID